MKLLVPNTSAGMVIGKAGARIKEIRDATGANIQVYPKQGSQEAKVSQERVITIAADDNGVLMGAVQRVLEKVAADPLHANNSDITITGGGGGGMKQPNSQPSNMNMGGGGGHEDYSAPYHMQQPQQQPMPPPGPYNDQSPYRSGPPGPPPAAGYTPQFVPPPQYGGPPTYSPAQGQPLGPPPPQRPVENMYGGGGPVVKDVYTNNGSQAGSYKFNPMQGLGNSEVLAFLDNLQSTLRTSGFNEQAVAEVMQAMQVLAKYNIMGLGLGLGVASMAQMRSTGGGGGGGGSGGGGGGNGGYESSRRADSPDLSDSKYGIRGGNESLGGVLIDVMSQGNQKNQNFASSIIKERPQLDPGFLELEVPDAIVGAVLGQKAKTLQDIQHFSGAKVEVHKRSGNSTSGTRLITLSGDADHVRAGRVMIEQVINDEQNRRLHHQQRSFI
uniref:K Homology domain-containing protein n=1 Tax=Plectus sambesii TaxID=2011161 RepID=A0A914W0G4_9BILA